MTSKRFPRMVVLAATATLSFHALACSGSSKGKGDPGGQVTFPDTGHADVPLDTSPVPDVLADVASATDTADAGDALPDTPGDTVVDSVVDAQAETPQVLPDPGQELPADDGVAGDEDPGPAPDPGLDVPQDIAPDTSGDAPALACTPLAPLALSLPLNVTPLSPAAVRAVVRQEGTEVGVGYWGFESGVNARLYLSRYGTGGDLLGHTLVLATQFSPSAVAPAVTFGKYSQEWWMSWRGPSTVQQEVGRVDSSGNLLEIFDTPAPSDACTNPIAFSIAAGATDFGLAWDVLVNDTRGVYFQEYAPPHDAVAAAAFAGSGYGPASAYNGRFAMAWTVPGKGIGFCRYGECASPLLLPAPAPEAPGGFALDRASMDARPSDFGVAWSSGTDKGVFFFRIPCDGAACAIEPPAGQSVAPAPGATPSNAVVVAGPAGFDVFWIESSASPLCSIVAARFDDSGLLVAPGRLVLASIDEPCSGAPAVALVPDGFAIVFWASKAAELRFMRACPDTI